MVLFRVRLSLLQERLIACVAHSIRPTRDPRVRARRQQRVITRFVTGFRARWEAVTACAPGYVIEDCGAN